MTRSSPSVPMADSIIRFVNLSDDDRDQVVFCARESRSRRPPVAWRVVEPLPRNGTTTIAIPPPVLAVSWEGGASGIRSDHPFGAFVLEERERAYTLRRTARGRAGRFELTSCVRQPGGIAGNLESGARSLVAAAPIGFRQRIVLAVPRVLAVVLARGAVEGEVLSEELVLSQAGSVALDGRSRIVELRGDLGAGYFLAIGDIEACGPSATIPDRRRPAG